MRLKEEKNKKLEYLRGVENRISRNLFWIAGGVGVTSMIMMIIAFFTRGAFPSGTMSMFYLGIVIVYAFHRELTRWLSEHEGKIERHGEYFVYAWIALTTIFYLIDFFTKGYFSTSPTGEHLPTLRETASLTIEVLIIFILTRGLKVLRIALEK